MRRNAAKRFLSLPQRSCSHVFVWAYRLGPPFTNRVSPQAALTSDISSGPGLRETTRWTLGVLDSLEKDCRIRLLSCSVFWHVIRGLQQSCAKFHGFLGRLDAIVALYYPDKPRDFANYLVFLALFNYLNGSCLRFALRKSYPEDPTLIE